MARHSHLVGVITIAWFIAALPFITHNGFYLKVAFLVEVNYLAAVGLNVLVGLTGQKSLGHAGLFAVGAYTAALLSARLGWNPWIAFAMAGVLAGLFGIVIALPALRVKGPALAMVTIGFGIVVEKIVGEWQDVFGGQAGIYGVVAPTYAGKSFGMTEWLWFAGALALTAHVMLRSLVLGKYGRAFRAVNAAELAAESVGVSVYRTKVLAFVISAVTCGFAGAMIAQQNEYISSDFVTFNLSVFFLLIVLFGGSSVYGPVLGALVLTLLDAFLARWPELQHFAYGALLLFALYVMPDGLAGALTAGAHRLFPGLTNPPDQSMPTRPWALRGVDIATPDQPLLQATGLYKAYGGVVPVNQVDIDLKTGHIHSLIGPNGAGKTTLLNVLSGIVPPDGGRIRFNGTDIAQIAPNRIARLGLGRTFQNLKLFADMTVLDNVKVGLHASMKPRALSYLFGLPSAVRSERLATDEALQILDFLGLRGKAHERAGSLPYGLQRRLELARALATHPRLLMLDEPAAGLNPNETRELIGVISSLRGLGITILLIEHHMDLVMAISDHVIVIDYGAKIAEGKPAEVQINPRVIAAYLGPEELEDAVTEAGHG